MASQLVSPRSALEQLIALTRSVRIEHGFVCIRVAELSDVIGEPIFYISPRYFSLDPEQWIGAQLINVLSAIEWLRENKMGEIAKIISETFIVAELPDMVMRTDAATQQITHLGMVYPHSSIRLVPRVIAAGGDLTMGYALVAMYGTQESVCRMFAHGCLLLDPTPTYLPGVDVHRALITLARRLEVPWYETCGDASWILLTEEQASIISGVRNTISFPVPTHQVVIPLNQYRGINLPTFERVRRYRVDTLAEIV